MVPVLFRNRLHVSAVVFGSLLAAPGAFAPAYADEGFNDRPDFIVGQIITTHYDGNTDDLLTAGLGASGIGSSTPPGYIDPAHPTPAELRRAAIYTNYRALIDPTPGGGYGTFYGPSVAADGTPTTGSGKIAGTEVLALASIRHESGGEGGGDDNQGHGYQKISFQDGPAANITLMVQIPDSYDLKHGCIITGPSSGSRGVYGAIATSGDWGLKHGCAVAYTDRGSGTGAYDMQNDLADDVQGVLKPAATLGLGSQFTPNISAAQRAAFNSATPNRFAFKHAHSQVNPEADWGRDVLASIKFAFYVLNQRYGYMMPINKSNTIVIASSVSNGGGASVRAAEEDEEGLIDGIAVSEPNVNPTYSNKFTIIQGGGTPLVNHSRPLIDYITVENLYAGCAAFGRTDSPVNLAPSAGRCAALQANGLLTSTTTAAQAAEAQSIINNFGILPEQNFVSPSHWGTYVHQSIAMTYANSYGRFSVLDNLCGYSLGATVSGVPAPLAANAEAQLFGASNGIPPTSGVNLINNVVNLEDRVSTPDQDLRGALCLRSLATGLDPVTGKQLTGALAEQSERVRAGVMRILATGNLHGLPAIFATGRNDGVLPPNFTSRAYFGLNHLVEGQRSDLIYWEVLNAQHLDSFNGLPSFGTGPAFATTLIPLHRYYIAALNAMYAHLTTGAPIPPSQVVRTTPRGPAAPPLTAANVPLPSASPAAGDVITFSNGAVRIPN